MRSRLAPFGDEEFLFLVGEFDNFFVFQQPHLLVSMRCSPWCLVGAGGRGT